QHLEDARLWVKANGRSLVAALDALGVVPELAGLGRLPDGPSPLPDEMKRLESEWRSHNGPDAEGASPVARLCNLILLTGPQKGASHARVDLASSRCQVLLRLDGEWRHEMLPPHRLASTVLWRFKQMAALPAGPIEAATRADFSFSITRAVTSVRVFAVP